jgi:hypothetical protein
MAHGCASEIAARMLGLQLGRSMMAVGGPGVNSGFEAMQFSERTRWRDVGLAGGFAGVFERTCSSALVGMPGYSASTGSCTMAAPPPALIAAKPAVPSSCVPDRMIPMTRAPRAAAAERNRTSTEGRWLFSRGPIVSRSRPSSITRCRSGGATRISPRQSGSPSLAGRHGSEPALLRMPARALGLVGAMCNTMQIAAGRPGGKPLTTRLRVSTPPAEAPMTTRSLRAATASATVRFSTEDKRTP